MLFGDDLDTLVAIGQEINEVIAGIRGARDVQVEQTAGQPQVVVRIDRLAVARLGIDVSDVQDVVRDAIGGVVVGQVFEGQRRLEIHVRYGENARRTVGDLGRALVAASLGLVPLLLSSGAGSEIQRPLATVVVGGLVTSTALTLLVLPALYGAFERRGVESREVSG